VDVPPTGPTSGVRKTGKGFVYDSIDTPSISFCSMSKS
jgi:hypothetical protein